MKNTAIESLNIHADLQNVDENIRERYKYSNNLVDCIRFFRCERALAAVVPVVQYVNIGATDVDGVCIVYRDDVHMLT